MSLKLSTLAFSALAASQFSQAAIVNAPMYGKSCRDFKLGGVKGDVYYSNDCGSAFIAPNPQGKLTVTNDYVDRSSCARYDTLKKLYDKTDNLDQLLKIDEMMSKLRGADINFTIETGWDDLVEMARVANPKKSIHKMNLYKANAGAPANVYEIPGISENSENKLVGGASGVMHLRAEQVCAEGARDKSASEILQSVPVNVFYTYRPYTDFEYTAEFNSQYFINDLKANAQGNFADLFKGEANVLAKTYTVKRFFDFKIAGTPGQFFNAEKLQEIGGKKLLQYMAEMAEFVGCSANGQIFTKNILSADGELQKVVAEACSDMKFNETPGDGTKAELKLSDQTKNLEATLTEIYCTKTSDGKEVEDKECKNAKAIGKVLMLSEIVGKADIKTLIIDFHVKDHLQTVDYVESYQSTSFSVQPEN